MPSVGGVTCDYVHGSAAGLKMAGQTWTVPGMSGYGALVSGYQDSESRFTLVRINTSPAVHTWAGLIEALQYTLVTLVNDHGETTTDFLVRRVSQPRIRGCRYGGVLGARGEIQIEGVRT